MSLLNYKEFLGESFLNEASTADQLIGMFSKFRKNLSKQREKELLAFASTSFATELGAAFTGLLNNDNYMTVYDTVIKMRKGKNQLINTKRQSV